MTAPNHIVGGIVFTGSFCSLFNINIFANPLFCVIAFVGCLLPDIDHTKSLIGKSVYPLAKFISRNYGHRTITHSIFFLGSLTFVSLILEQIFSTNFHISTILFFSVLSHFIFDMITIQGIPLLYPFYKNPCVIPGNQKLRIRTGDRKSEGTFFFIFAILSFTLFSLFQQGFWTTFNNKFNDISHVYSSFKKTPNLLKVDYNYNFFNQNYSGESFLISAEQNKIYLFDKKKITTIEKGQQGIIIEKLQTKNTNKTMEIVTSHFNSISIDSVNQILKNKLILSASIFSSENAYLINEESIEKSKHFQVSNVFDVYFKSDNLKFDSKENSIKYIQNLESKIQDKEIELQIKLQAISSHNQEFNKLKNKKIKLENTIENSSDLYEINEAKNQIIILNKNLKSFKSKPNSVAIKIKSQIRELEKKIKTEKNKKVSESEIIYFTGSVNWLIIPE